MKEFEIRTKVFFGDNALDRLTKIPYKRVLIVTDPFVLKSGMIDLVTKRLETGRIDFKIFSDVVPDPPIEKVTAGAKVMAEYHPEAIITIGGGSAIDSAKAIKEVGSSLSGGEPVALIAIPTTSGTGSEVTSFSVITDPAANKKYPLVKDSLTPDEAILDAVLVKSVPPGITADTGMDVLTHAIEAYVSTNSNDFSDALAEKAIQICGGFLLRSYLDNEDTHARQKMHTASCMAGLAFNSASLGLNHGIAHTLGAHFHIPHGRANAMVLPYVIEFNSDINKHSKSKAQYLPAVHKYVTIANNLNLNGFNEIMTVRSLVNWIQFMLKEMNIPMSVEQTGVGRDEYFAVIDEMAEAALKDSCTATNPRVSTKEDVIRILTDLYD